MTPIGLGEHVIIAAATECTTQDDIAAYVKALKEINAREGTSILLVEQNARAALSVADYGYILDSGRVVLDGPSAELQAEKRVEAAYLGGHVQ